MSNRYKIFAVSSSNNRPLQQNRARSVTSQLSRTFLFRDNLPLFSTVPISYLPGAQKKTPDQSVKRIETVIQQATSLVSGNGINIPVAAEPYMLCKG